MHTLKEQFEKNRIGFTLLKSRKELLPLLSTLVPEGATVGSGGSVTLDETGVLDWLRQGPYHFLDRYVPNLTAAQQEEIFQQSLHADVYFTGCNALTEHGELYFVDGNANRVSAIAYGPKKVFVIVGKNKMVPDLPAAVERVKRIAAPKNARRLGCHTYCAQTGSCISLQNPGAHMSDGCDSKERICVQYLVSARQRKADRLHVFFIEEDLGY